MHMSIITQLYTVMTASHIYIKSKCAIMVSKQGNRSSNNNVKNSNHNKIAG